MKRYMIAVGLFVMISLPAGAAIATGVAGNCSLARDPLRCQAMEKARGACKEKRGSAKQKCIQEKLPLADCSRDTDPGRCEARQLAREACKGKSGRAKQVCLEDMRLATGAPIRVR